MAGRRPTPPRRLARRPLQRWWGTGSRHHMVGIALSVAIFAVSLGLVILFEGDLREEVPPPPPWAKGYQFSEVLTVLASGCGASADRTSVPDSPSSSGAVQSSDQIPSSPSDFSAPSTPGITSSEQASAAVATTGEGCLPDGPVLNDGTALGNLPSRPDGQRKCYTADASSVICGEGDGPFYKYEMVDQKEAGSQAAGSAASDSGQSSGGSSVTDWMQGLGTVVSALLAIPTTLAVIAAARARRRRRKAALALAATTTTIDGVESPIDESGGEAVVSAERSERTHESRPDGTPAPNPESIEDWEAYLKGPWRS